uniref:Discs, large (Drosophila) homolog-associated protein 3 n=1 Tax=Amphilophus citrinellus TaxID=61819 RepID=A0A3Q0QY15_AMPCI
MKGYHVSRSMSQHSSGGGGGGPCHCTPDDCDGPGRDYYHGHSDGHYYPGGGPVEALALERHHSRSHSHSHSGGGTFPRSHPSQHPPLQSFDSCEECLSSGHGGKMHRMPSNMMDQFEKQVPFHHDGFHTLQYQRTASGGAEQRSESPSRIRHLVNSVQRLFAKSHSLEAPSKREYNGTRGGGDYRGERGGGHRSGGEDGHYSGHQSRSTRRNKSRERSKSGDSRHESGRRHRSRTAGWWSSDDNLDSDSSYLVGGGRPGYPRGHESLDAAIQELTMKKPKERGGGPGSGECMACTTMALAGSEGGGGGHHGHHGHSLKRSTWSAMTVSQAREVYPSTRGGGGYDKALVPMESKLKERTFHYLQVPSEDWGGGYSSGNAADSGGEIPCRRMRSGSYIKAMGDDDSADSDTSPKASPKSTLIAQRDAFRRSISMDQRRYSCKQCTDSYPNNRTAPKTHTRSRSYTRSLTSTQTMFGEVESQAVEALDLPGVFRTRSHSYVRAIQAGCSQDDDCLSVFSMSGPQGSIKGGAFPYRKGAPPPLPPRMSKSSLSVRAQSSTESTQDAYFQSSGQLVSSAGPGRPKQHSNSVDLGNSDGPSGRTSRGGYYTGSGPGRSRQHSNSAESLDGVRGSRELVPYGGGPGVGVRAKHSSSADSLLEGPPRPARERDSRVGGSLGKSASLPQNSIILSKGGGQDEGRGVRKWRPSIAVQVDSSETLSDSDAEGKALTEVHSVGVQVEDDKTEACQADTRPHQQPHLPPRSHSPLPITSERAWAGTPSLEGPRSLPDSGRASPCMRDGEFFLRLLQTEVERMEGWCQNMEREAEENELPEELELIRNAVGSAQMLMSQKVQQFFRLCQQSVQDPSAYPQPTSQDLAAFWDLLQLNIEDVRVKFQDLQRLKDSGWRLPPEKKEDKKLPPPLPKKPAGGVSGSLRADSVGDGVVGGGGGGSGGLVVPRVGGHTLPIREKSMDLGDRQRTEARRRLLQTRRTASFRQNSATESADSIEIYIPEAQTRL